MALARSSPTEFLYPARFEDMTKGVFTQPAAALMLGREVISMGVLAWVVRVVAIAIVALAVAASAGTTRNAAAALPPGNTVAQWNKIAEDTVVGSGAFQSEGLIYMAYASAAVYDAVVAIEGGFEPYGPAITSPAGASIDAAVVEAAYRTLWAYFPPESCNPASPPAVYAFCLGIRPSL